MSFFRNVAIAILVLSLLTFIALFGQLPALRKTPIGWLQRALCLHLPNGLKRVDGAVTGGRLVEKSERLGYYLFYEKNPVVLILFLVLLSGSIILFVRHGTHQLPWSPLFPLWPLILLPYTFTYLCVTYTSHYIDHSNHSARMQDYPYDHKIFWPYKACATCKQLKPPRSKHCSLCGFCVAKCDHHCPWVNNCLGRGNYRWFLALLLSLGVLQIYGAYLAWTILQPNVHISAGLPLFSRARLNNLGQALVIAVNVGGISIAGVGLLAAAAAPLPLGLLAYHCYLVWAGMTTNESQKWTDWKEDMVDGVAFRADKQTLKAHNMDHMRSGVQMDGSHDLILNPTDEEHVKISWPVTSNEVLARTNDGKPPRGQETLWTRVWNLNEVVNIYDLGAWQNLVEVLIGR